MKNVMRILLVLTVACTNTGKAQRTLEASGYTQIEMTGYSWGACAKDDDTCTGFVATAPNGHRVSGAVGCGYVWKGCTIRIEP